MKMLRHAAVFTIAFVKDIFSAAQFRTMSFIQKNDGSWMFPALMVISFLGALYLSIPPDQRSRLLRFQPRKINSAASRQRSTSDIGFRAQIKSSHATSTPPPSLFGVEYKTPQPGPAFGHFLSKTHRVPELTSRTFVNRQNIDLQSSLDYQTFTPKSTPTSSPNPDYAKLSQSAPTTYSTLQHMGLLDHLGTPTKKLKDSHQKQKFGVTVNHLGDVRDKNGTGVQDDPFLIDGED